jgi:hypothetical protein
MDEGLHAEAHALGVEHRAGGAHDARRLQPLPPPRGLAGGEIQPLAKRLRGQGRILLDQCEQTAVGLLNTRIFVNMMRHDAESSRKRPEIARRTRTNRVAQRVSFASRTDTSGDAHGTLPA